jgi:hypothetical protein
MTTMKWNRLALLSPLLVLGVVVAVSGPGSDDGKLLQFTVDGIRSGLEQSPDNYFAAMVEVAGDKQCVDLETQEVCFHDVTVIKVYAQRGNALAKGQRVKMLGEGSAGSRALFFAIPAVPDLAVYGGTFATAKVDATEEGRFLEALRAVGLQQDA